MGRGEPAFKPEWLKSANGVLTGNGSSNRHAGACSNSDEFGLGVCSRNRSYLSSSSWRSENSGKLHGYSSFGRSNRERDRDRDFDLLDREFRSACNGFHDHSESFLSSRREQDMLHSKESIVGPSFEKEFPTLGSGENNRLPDVGRVPSPGVNTPIPTTTGANGLGFSSISRAASVSQVAAPVIASTGLSTNTGLNMAETVAQAPPQLSSNSQRSEELTRRQCEQLRPVMASMPRTSGRNCYPGSPTDPPPIREAPYYRASGHHTRQSLQEVPNSSDKSKNIVSKSGDSSTAAKTEQKLSSQHATSCLLTPLEPDFARPSRLGSLQVLNRERNGLSTTTKGNLNIRKAASPVGLAASASLNSPNLQKPKADSKVINMSSPQSSFGERRSHLQAKDRLEFFNSIRNKTVNSSSGMPEPGSVLNPTSFVDSREQAVNNEKGGVSDCELKCSKNGKCVCEDKDACEEFERLLHDNEETNAISEPVDPEEEVFLRSLGWDQNAAVDVLTKEEIDAFNIKYKERKQPLKLPH